MLTNPPGWFFAVFVFGLGGLACDKIGTTPPVEGQKNNYLAFHISERDGDTQKGIALKAFLADGTGEPVTAAESPNGSLSVMNNGFQAGVYDGSTFTVSDYHTTDVIFLNQGKIFRLPVYQVSELKPLQLSSESDAYKLCVPFLRRGNDYAQQNNSRIIYKLVDDKALLDTCKTASGRYYSIKYNDNETTSPQQLSNSITKVIDAVHAEDSGALIGWIVIENSQLKYYDADFVSGQTFNTSAGAIVVDKFADLLTRTAEKRFVFNIDNNIYIFSIGAGVSLLNGAASFSKPGEGVVNAYSSDGTSMFFTFTHARVGENTASLSELHRLDMAIGATTKMHEEDAGIQQLTNTDNQVIFSANIRNGEKIQPRIKKISKEGGLVSDIGLPDLSAGAAAIYAKQSYFYINVYVDDHFDLLRVNENDVSGETFSRHRIVGATYSSTLKPAKFYLDPNYYILLQSDDATNQKNIHSIDVTTGVMQLVGAVASDAFLDPDIAFISAFGRTQSLVGLYHNAFFDLYYFDAAVPNSLKRMTETAGEAEHALYYKPGYQ